MTDARHLTDQIFDYLSDPVRAPHSKTVAMLEVQAMIERAMSDGVSGRPSSEVMALKAANDRLYERVAELERQAPLTFFCQ